MREPTLGLCDPPHRRYLFIGQDEGDSGACWYELNENKNKIYVPKRALAGYLTGIRLAEHDMGRHGKKWKFDLLLDAGQPFAVRSGLETVFTRGVVLALTALAVEDITNLAQPIIIAVQPSTEQSKIVFGSVYVEHTGRRVKAEWDKNAELVPLIEHLQSIVGNGGGSEEEGESDDDHGSPAPDRSNHRDAQPRSERPAGLANADVLKELKRVAVSIGWVIDGTVGDCDLTVLNLECARQYPYCQTIEDLKTGDAIAFRKLLLEM